MRVRTALLLACLLLGTADPGKQPAAAQAVAAQLPRGMVRIEGATFRPLYHTGSDARVSAFAIDTVPVSIAAFLRFVRDHPAWSRERVPGHLADGDYLKGMVPAASAGRRPIRQVSWHAALAYCQSRGARLPTTLEWEYLARADERDRNAAARSSFQQRALELSLAAHPETFIIGTGLRNIWGVRDIHGGVMEWTQDFRADTVSTHRHQDQPDSGAASCASGTVQTGAASDYAAFMRYAIRAAATERTAAGNIGFRCARQ
jgi:formylglycine-generating enzyme required for sulfatase activity